ncbi:Uncharacterised protein [Actinobacillus pleuropneumoniae]|nr:Uncharacterised protein [Actinobacillus pleuropneumoniae]
MINPERPVKIACTTYKTGAMNMNANSSGSVIPVKNDATAEPIKMEPTSLRLDGLAVCMKASAAAGIANIMIGKKPDMNIPAVGSPAKKRHRSP